MNVNQPHNQNNRSGSITRIQAHYLNEYYRDSRFCHWVLAADSSRKHQLDSAPLLKLRPP
jgi:hypothetical protein